MLFFNILALLAGLLVSGLVISFVQWIGHYVYPVVGLDGNTSRDELKRKIAKLPFGAFIFVELAYILGSLCGGAVISLSASPELISRAATLLAFALTVCGVLNLLAIPHPLWFSIISTASFFPSVFSGVFLIRYLR